MLYVYTYDLRLSFLIIGTINLYLLAHALVGTINPYLLIRTLTNKQWIRDI